MNKKTILRLKNRSLLNKGFTLVELLAVIVLLAIVSLIATPIIGNVIDLSRDEANKRSIEGYAEAVRNEYYSQLTDESKPTIDSEFLSNVDTQGNKIDCENVLYSKDYQVILNECIIADDVDRQYCYADGKHYDCNNNDFFDIIQTTIPDYVDNSGANRPEITANMIPVRYDGTNWVYASKKEKWYDYEAQEWANAVVLNSGITKNIGDIINEDEIALWYVWIPRYKYQLFNVNNGSVSEQLINIEFENGTETTGSVSCTDAINKTDSDGDSISEMCTNASNGNWYTHPAFTFGDEEITGFWVGKFEVSGTLDEITIKPNVNSLRSQTVSNFFTAIQNISTTYNLSGDSHMMKNMEWGAVAYLKQSKYGLGTTDIGINNNSSLTGCGASAGSSESSTCNAYNTSEGMKASTTGNIYGVYDMSGGAWEYLMGNMVDSTGLFYSSNAGFSNAPEDKYYDKYTNDNEERFTHNRGKLGDATKEIVFNYLDDYSGWYGDYSCFVNYTLSWFYRGGDSDNSSSAGIFNFGRYYGLNGSQISTRAILVSEIL